MEKEIITIDGAHGEGGGQIIRTAMTLSAITQKAITIQNIRPKRDKPGLQSQHLTACRAVKTICQGDLNADLHSTTLSFTPSKIVGGNYEFDIGTAGSVILVAQTILPLLFFAEQKSTVKITGGTHIRNSPTFDYFYYVFIPAIKKLGAEIEVDLKRLGFFPRGGGMIELKANPSNLQGNTYWETPHQKIRAIIRLANLYSSIAQREQFVLNNHGIHEIEINESQADSPGNAITIWQGFNGSTVLGERGKLAEKVAEEAVQLMRKETAEVDCHLADQLLIYSVLANGKTAYRTSKISDHLKTNIYTLSFFSKREILVEGNLVTVGE